MEPEPTKVTMMSRTSLPFLLVGLMVTCGGGGVTDPTGTPVLHDGTYSGRMTFSDDHTTTGAQTTVTQSGSALHFTDLVLSGGASVSAGVAAPLGSATLTGEDFNGTSSYSSKACVTTLVKYQGRFSGKTMSLKVTFASGDPGVGCGGFDLEGELSR